MPVACAAQDLPVLFLYNVEPDWERQDTTEALATNQTMVEALKEVGHPVISVELADRNLATLLASHASDHRIVFNQCESLPGIPHSEHTVVEIIEKAGFAYTGSSPAVIQLASDKAASKRLLDAHQILTPAWRVFDEPKADGWRIFPAIVKNSREHCSLGLNAQSVVLNTHELQTRIAFILEHFNQPALVEDFIDGREFHVPVWGNGAVTVLPAVEMDFSAFDDVHDRLCTYEAKFNPDSHHYRAIESRIPAPLTDDERRQLEQICLTTYHAFGCRDYARLDIRKRGDQFHVLEINPNADLDREASIACASAHLGISYSALLSRLVRFAAARHPFYTK